ncbi:hypothetical protein EDM22_00400 [Agromyces tardus]|jgi:hypothetical protein|uniref:Uncharacterized protein n=1 Tax=Agromyces tardus TaxID=2583849 RepID=A0A3M8ALY1_9MICO|nr:glycoside hydrolase family 25 protein [Agromyces tardus]RNB52216.1 hypothetical protein EDM22_00400 [Agromyces tardus]
MTYGIDVGTSQREIDLRRARDDGAEFVIVKAGGFNTGELYVAPFYQAQIEGAMAAGLPRGHYWLVGGVLGPESQADYFVQHLHGFDASHDVLALDNERLDRNGTFWNQGDAVRFLARVQALTGIAWNRLWHYAGASDYRGHTPWGAVADLGVRFWWAAYGDGPTGHRPDHIPDLQGSIPTAHVHQFSSNSNCAGFALDGNHTDLSVADLFATPAVAGVAAMAASPLRGAGIPRTSTEDDGVPGLNYWKRYQVVASRFGYTGPIDGDPGRNTHRGFARFLNALDLPGQAKTNTDIDGIPGRVFNERLQLLAQKNGYAGPIDGRPGAETFKGVARYLNRAV